MVQKKNLNKNKGLLLYNAFLNSFVKKGNKQKINKLLNNVFINLAKNYKESIALALLLIFKQLFVYVEIKNIKIRRRQHMIPFFLRYKRRVYLVLKWLKLAIKEDTRDISFSHKLKNEIKKLLLKKKNSKSFKLKKINLSQAHANRFSVHYRW